MGSFTEIDLSFAFAPDTPQRVLAAVSALAVPGSRAGVPALPPPVVEAWDDFEPDWRMAGYEDGEGDPYEDEPWRHDWAMWLTTAMGVATTPHGRLVWSDAGRWHLDCRFSWKTDPETASEALAWLAPYVDGADAPGRTVVGHARYETEAPQRLWVEAGRWELEDAAR